MRYMSTRGQAPEASFSDVLLAGLAPDGGLYVPKEYPQITHGDLDYLRTQSYQQIALHVLRLYCDDISEGDLRGIIGRSYNPRLFGSNDITPIQPLADRWGILKLSNGPTMAFKDVALQLLANLMEHVLTERDQVLNLLGATSGDTGSAAEWAIIGKERLRIFMMSPEIGMTPIQQMQMYRVHDERVHNLVVSGNFDDCQAAFKLVNGDAEFKARYSIGAVNSVNWARIVAQVIYYVYAYTRVIHDPSEILTVCVPSGNFGNGLAAYIAHKMGLRLNIIVATNENDVLCEFFNTGVYRVRAGDELKHTHSPSMDIASASNFERFMFDLVDRDPSKLRSLWEELGHTGQFTFPSLFDGGFRDPPISAGSATDAQVLNAICLVYNWYGVVVDPHTAVAIHVGFDRGGGSGLGPTLFLETAQPAKFEEVIGRALGLRMGIPRSCRHLENYPDRFERIEESEPEAIAARVKQIIEATVG